MVATWKTIGGRHPGLDPTPDNEWDEPLDRNRNNDRDNGGDRQGNCRPDRK